MKTLFCSIVLLLSVSSWLAAQDRVRFRDLDRNGDGVISRQEWPGNDRSFRAQDRNGDGVLSRDEVNERGDAVRSFGLIDYDGNGRVTRDEWIRAFSQLDMNGDGVLTEEEFQGTRADTQPVASRAFEAGRERGLADGREAGRGDKASSGVWDLEGQRELEQADAGYRPAVGSREEYQAGYREGFRRGYAEGFGPRRSSRQP